MKTFPAPFTAEKDKKTGPSPVWILKCPFATGTVYLSDMAFSVASWNNGITTKAWVKEWGAIDEDISGDLSLAKVSDFSVQVLIDPNHSPNVEDIINSSSNNVETTDIELYLWFLGLDASVSPPQLMWTGNIMDYSSLDELVCQLDLVDQGVKTDKYVGTLLDLDDYPKMDPADAGKIIPIVIGSVQKVPIPCVVAGGAAALTAGVTSTATAIYVDDGSCFPAAGTFYVKIGDEIITCAGHSSGTFLSVSGRGALSTTATAHSEGDTVAEYIPTGYKYVVSDGERAVSVGNVYVDGQLMPAADVTKSGGTGSLLLPHVILTHGPVDTSPERISPLNVTNTNWSNAGYAIDGDDTTYANSIYTTSNYLTINFASSTRTATVVRQEIEVILTVPSGVTLTFSGWTCNGASSLTNTSGTKKFVKSGGARSDNLTFVVSSSPNLVKIYEVGPKSVFTYKVNPGGETGAKVLVGSVVTADISTSTALQRPDTAIKSLLTTYGGWSEDNFVTDADTYFTSKGYIFSNLYIGEYRKLREWLSLLAFQCRCYFRFANGKACLLYRPDGVASDKTITDAMIRMGDGFKTTLKVERSSLDEVINKINLKYNRDWTKSGADAYKSLTKATDAASIAKYGEKERTDLFTFDFVKTKAMATDLRDFYLARYKDRKRIFTMEVFLDNAELEFADGISLTPMSDTLCEIQKVNITPGSGRDMRNDKIQLVAREY